MLVHHCDDHVVIRHYSKNDTERKRHRETTTNAIFDFVIQVRVNLDSIEGILNRGKEPFPEILLLGLIKLCRQQHL